MRVAIVTPYCGEPVAKLRRCHVSVRGQTHKAVHFMVADGEPSAEVASWDVEHIVLSTPHFDGGDTPRAIGALAAINQGYDAVGFLDADNWLASHHVETCVQTCEKTGVDVAFAGRWIVLSSGELCPFDDRDSFEKRHVDTSCFFVTSRAAFLLPLWGLIGPEVWQACDRIMFAAVKAREVPHAWTEHRTVYYSSHWDLHFREMGLPVPIDHHCIDWPALNRAYSRSAIISRFGFDPKVSLGDNNVHLAVNGVHAAPRVVPIDTSDARPGLRAKVWATEDDL